VGSLWLCSGPWGTWGCWAFLFAPTGRATRMKMNWTRIGNELAVAKCFLEFAMSLLWFSRKVWIIKNYFFLNKIFSLSNCFNRKFFFFFLFLRSKIENKNFFKFGVLFCYCVLLALFFLIAYIQKKLQHIFIMSEQKKKIFSFQL